MDEFTGVDGTMSLADAGKRNMIEEINAYPAVLGAKIMNYTINMPEPGIVVTINEFERKEIDRTRRSMEATRGPQPQWADGFVDFVEQFGYEYDGAEGDGLSPRKVDFYFKAV